MVFGEPSDAPTLDTLRALRGVNAHTPILYAATEASEGRRRVPRGANGFLAARSTQLEIEETLERHWRMAADPDDVLVAGPIRLELRSRSVTVDGVTVRLPGKRLDLLAYFLKSPNRVVPKAELALAVVGTLRGDPRRIPKEVCAVRAALGRAASMLETCGAGYRLNCSATPNENERSEPFDK
jgi:DNA-binding response OmpR family regulator